MLPFVEHWTTFWEKLLEFSLVEMNDQVFEGNRLKILTLILRHRLLIAPEDRNGLVAESLNCLSRLASKN